MITLADQAIETVLDLEGGLVDHPADPGGLTNFGISLRAFPHLGREGILNMTRERAAEIYREVYWSRVPEGLDDGLRWMVFDTAVNSGTGRALAWLEDHPTLASFTARRLRFVAGLSTFPSFGRGWSNRIARVLSAIDAWEDAVPKSATRVVAEDLSLADRIALAFGRSPVVLRGSFAWRSRGTKLDVRRRA